MLKVMRKHAKYFYVLFVLVILSFIFWGVGDLDNSATPPLAEVGDEDITLDEYWRAYEAMSEGYRETYKEKLDEKTREILKQTVLYTLIEERVLLIAAEEVGMEVSDRELEDAIVNEPVFMRNGLFSRDVYLNTLRLNRITPTYYESARRRELLRDKMVRLVEESVDLTPSEIEYLSGDPEIRETIEKTLLKSKRQAALRSFLAGVKKRIVIKVRPELIG